MSNNSKFYRTTGFDDFSGKWKLNIDGIFSIPKSSLHKNIVLSLSKKLISVREFLYALQKIRPINM